MGLIIKKSKRGYRIFTSADESAPLHQDYYTKDNVIWFLMMYKLQEFYKDIIILDMDELAGYEVNGKEQKLPKGISGMEFVLSQYKLHNNAEEVFKHFRKLARQILKDREINM